MCDEEEGDARTILGSRGPAPAGHRFPDACRAGLFIPAAGLFLMIWHILAGWQLYRIGAAPRIPASMASPPAP